MTKKLEVEQSLVSKSVRFDLRFCCVVWCAYTEQTNLRKCERVCAFFSFGIKFILKKEKEVSQCVIVLGTLRVSS